MRRDHGGKFRGETVTGESTQRDTKKISAWDQSVASTEIGADQDCARLSYLKGAINTNDMGPTLGNPGMAYDDYETRWRNLDTLRRHTIWQGLSTFVKNEDFQ